LPSPPERYESAPLSLGAGGAKNYTSGNVCPDGSDCIFAHKCPYLPNCHHLKENRCWFRGGKYTLFAQFNGLTWTSPHAEDMHTPDEKLPQEDDFELDNLLNFRE
jgi:hypothetical protein